jgi:hypothetical protein
MNGLRYSAFCRLAGDSEVERFACDPVILLRTAWCDSRRPTMSDDKANPGNPDRQRIDINDPNELRSWSKSMGVTPEELKSAVKQVGPVATKVREYLKQ